MSIVFISPLCHTFGFQIIDFLFILQLDCRLYSILYIFMIILNAFQFVFKLILFMRSLINLKLLSTFRESFIWSQIHGRLFLRDKCHKCILKRWSRSKSSCRSLLSRWSIWFNKFLSLF